MTRHLWLEGALVFLLVVAGARCLRNVSLEVLPEAVQRGQEVILRCHYDLEKQPLYVLKWYRGNHEFYRFMPKDEQPTKIFNVTGIHVDPEKSNSSQVTLRDVDFALSGQFSCDVTTDRPRFSSATAYKNLTVVSLPEGKPVIVSERERYDPGETLRANCSLPPSRPPAQLSFTLNNSPLQPSAESQEHQQEQAQKGDHRRSERQWIEIDLNLQPFHYSNGQLTLRCTAQIPGIYSAVSEVQLGAGLREPVPERVTFGNGCEGQGFVIATFTTLLMMTLQLLLR